MFPAVTLAYSRWELVHRDITRNVQGHVRVDGDVAFVHQLDSPNMGHSFANAYLAPSILNIVTDSWSFTNTRLPAITGCA